MEFKETFGGEFKTLKPHILKFVYKTTIPIFEAWLKAFKVLFTVKPPALSDTYKPFYFNLP